MARGSWRGAALGGGSDGGNHVVRALILRKCPGAGAASRRRCWVERGDQGLSIVALSTNAATAC